MKSVAYIVGTSLFCIMLVGCKATHSTAQQPLSARQQLSYNDQQRIQNLYFESAKQRMLGNNSAAYEILLSCNEICPDIPEVLYDEGLYELGLHRDSTALLKFERACALDPQNVFYQETLASYYLNTRTKEKALPYLEKLAALQPSRSDVLSQLVSLYANAGSYDDAIVALNKIELLEGKLPNVSYQKYLLYRAQKEEEKAFDELEALCREYPHELSYRLTIAEELVKVGRIEEAQVIFDEVKKLEPESNQLKLSLLELYRATQQDSLFLATRDSLLYHQDTPSQVRIALLRDYITDEIKHDSIGKERIKNVLDRVDSLYPQDIELLQLQAAYLATYESKNDSAFLQVMDRMYELEPQNTQTLFYLMQYYAEHVQLDKLEDICRRGVLVHPEELVCHFYLGISCFQQGKKEEALKAFEAGLVQKNDQSKPTMVAELYNMMGDVLHELGRTEEAYAAYDSCLTYQDNKTMCLNNYAYFLCLENRDLDKAEEMSYRTLRLEPKNTTFIDTYAWILFTKGDYPEAQEYIDKVCNPELPDSLLQSDSTLSGVVFEHAGDIAAMNGNIEQALRFWQLALDCNDEDTTALLPRKIKLKKYLKP